MFYLKDLVTNEIIMKARTATELLKHWNKDLYIEEIVNHEKELYIDTH
jgi:hypothetical protein